jgi:hypothetical protein
VYSDGVQTVPQGGTDERRMAVGSLQGIYFAIDGPHFEVTMSKYQKLSEYLSSVTVARIQLSFVQVEKILGAELPESARSYNAWWGNDATPGRHSHAWLSAGWLTENVNLSGRMIGFYRSSRRPGAEAGESQRIAASRVTSAGMDDLRKLPDAPDASVSIAFQTRWKHLGAISMVHDALGFPPAPPVAGLYRMRLCGPDGTQHCYIGETVNLQRRFHHYRRPGPTQLTNIRMNNELRAHLHAGKHVELDVIVDVPEVVIEGVSRTADLGDKHTRRMVEYAAILTGGADVETLNR